MKTSKNNRAWHALLLVSALALPTATMADTVIGGWQSSSADGWIDWGNGNSITDLSNAGKYSFASGAVISYSQSLQITQAGYNQGLAIKLENTAGDMAAFLNNHLLSFTFSVPAGTAGGYSQLYALSINASGYGFNDQSFASMTATGDTSNNQSGQPNFYFYNGSPVQSQTVTLDYSSLLPLITATPGSGYIELIYSFNNGGGAPANFYMNNVVLSGGPVPEPSTLALAGLGLAGLLAVRRRRA